MSWLPRVFSPFLLTTVLVTSIGLLTGTMLPQEADTMASQALIGLAFIGPKRRGSSWDVTDQLPRRVFFSPGSLPTPGQVNKSPPGGGHGPMIAGTTLVHPLDTSDRLDRLISAEDTLYP